MQTFKQWFETQPESVLQLAVNAGVSAPTIYRAMAGLPVQYETAKAIADQTHGAITVVQLCEGDAYVESL